MRDRKLLVITGCAVGAIGIAAICLRAWDKVMSGHGLDTYRTAQGALMTYSSAVVGGVVCALCLTVAFGLKWRHHHQQRKANEILRARANAANTADGKSAGTDT